MGRATRVAGAVSAATGAIVGAASRGAVRVAVEVGQGLPPVRLSVNTVPTASSKIRAPTRANGGQIRRLGCAAADGNFAAGAGATTSAAARGGAAACWVGGNVMGKGRGLANDVGFAAPSDTAV